jgi:predicted nucleic acid-binding protein
VAGSLPEARAAADAPRRAGIAATALAHGYAVATRDDRSFSRVPGLTVRRW